VLCDLFTLSFIEGIRHFAKTRPRADFRVIALAHEINFTVRERQVLEFLRAGWSNKEISQKLNICERTVKFHVSSILGKSGKKRAQLFCGGPVVVAA
jgi:DNA-binding NarL/FixJ family response regulator